MTTLGGLWGDDKSGRKAYEAEGGGGLKLQKDTIDRAGQGGNDTDR